MIIIENVSKGDEYTLLRSHEGGAFKLFKGIYDQNMPVGDEGTTLADTHIENNADNLFAWLIEKLDIAQTRSHFVILSNQIIHLFLTIESLQICFHSIQTNLTKPYRKQRDNQS